MYLDLLEVAVWNRSGFPTRELKGVGSRSLSIVQMIGSKILGGAGVGLHSLPDSEDFYRRHRMTDFEPDIAYSRHHHLCYFEKWDKFGP